MGSVDIFGSVGGAEICFFSWFSWFVDVNDSKVWFLWVCLLMGLKKFCFLSSVRLGRIASRLLFRL